MGFNSLIEAARGKDRQKSGNTNAKPYKKKKRDSVGQKGEEDGNAKGGLNINVSDLVSHR